MRHFSTLLNKPIRLLGVLALIAMVAVTWQSAAARSAMPVPGRDHWNILTKAPATAPETTGRHTIHFVSTPLDTTGRRIIKSVRKDLDQAKDKFHDRDDFSFGGQMTDMFDFRGRDQASGGPSPYAAIAPATTVTTAPTPTSTQTPAAASPAAPTAGEPTINVAKNATLGSFLVGDKGMTLYIFTKDSPGQSNCDANCQKQWRPLLTQGKPNIGAGVDASLIGTATLADGSMVVTYNKMPLYYLAKDAKAGDVSGQGVGGVWFVISPAGQLINTPLVRATPASPSGSGNGGGNKYP